MREDSLTDSDKSASRHSQRPARRQRMAQSAFLQFARATRYRCCHFRARVGVGVGSGGYIQQPDRHHEHGRFVGRG